VISGAWFRRTADYQTISIALLEGLSFPFILFLPQPIHESLIRVDEKALLIRFGTTIGLKWPRQKRHLRYQE